MIFGFLVAQLFLLCFCTHSHAHQHPAPTQRQVEQQQREPGSASLNAELHLPVLERVCYTEKNSTLVCINLYSSKKFFGKNLISLLELSIRWIVKLKSAFWQLSKRVFPWWCLKNNYSTIKKDMVNISQFFKFLSKWNL